MEQNTFFRKIRNRRWQTSELQNIVFSLSQTCWDTLYYTEYTMIRVVLVATETPGAACPPRKLGTGKAEDLKFRFLNDGSMVLVDIMPLAGTIP